MTDARRKRLDAFYLRFEAWRVRSAPAAPLLDAVSRFLGAMPPSCQRAGRDNLRRVMGADALEWSRVPLAPYARNEARLRRTVMKPAELAQLWERAPLTTRERALLAACFTLRRIEVARLEWRYVDLGGEVGSVDVARGKGDRSGWTMLPPRATEALRAWGREVVVARGGAGPFPTAGLVFPATPTGRLHGAPEHPYNPDALGQLVRALLTRAGVWAPYRGAHAFRRTFATTFLRQRPGELRRLQVLMRHRQIATTTLYDYPDPDDYRGAVAGLRL